MKIRLTYTTKARKYLSETVYQNVTSPEIELEPVAIRRRSVGVCGKARSRYYYSAYFNAPSDAEFVINGEITCTINRKRNPQFKPSEILFLNDLAIMVGV